MLTGTLLLQLCIPICIHTCSGAPGDTGADHGLAGKSLRMAGLGIVKQAPRRILFLGDSMSMGAFGRTLDQKMRDAGLDVFTFVTGGATPYYWLSDYQPISSTIGHWMRVPHEREERSSMIKSVPKVETLIETYDPDIVVVQTGTNMYSTLRSKRRSDQANEKEVAYVYEKMCERVTEGGRRCYWITPPSAHEERYPADLQTRMRNLMKDTVSEYGRVFDSYEITRYSDPFPQTDGIHYGPDEAKAWANTVAEDFIHFATDGDGIGRKALPVQLNAAPETPRNDPPQLAAIGSGACEFGGPPLGREPIKIRIKLIAKSAIEDINQVTYKRAWAIDEYEVLSVDAGYYPARKLRLAEFIVNRRKIVREVQNRELNTVRSLEVVPLSNYPSLEQVEVVDDLEINFDLPVLTPRLD